MKLIPWVMALVAITVTVSAADLLGQDATPAQADKPWSLSFDATFVNKYIWRGQNLNNNASLQPGLAFTYKNLTVSSWSQFSHTGFGDSGVAGNHWTEHDLTVDYGFALSEKLSLNVGWINYAFPNLQERTATRTSSTPASAPTRFSSRASASTVTRIRAEGLYYNLGIGHGLDLGNGFGSQLVSCGRSEPGPVDRHHDGFRCGARGQPRRSGQR